MMRQVKIRIVREEGKGELSSDLGGRSYSGMRLSIFERCFHTLTESVDCSGMALPKNFLAIHIKFWLQKSQFMIGQDRTRQTF